MKGRQFLQTLCQRIDGFKCQSRFNIVWVESLTSSPQATNRKPQATSHKLDFPPFCRFLSQFVDTRLVPLGFPFVDTRRLAPLGFQFVNTRRLVPLGFPFAYASGG